MPNPFLTPQPPPDLLKPTQGTTTNPLLSPQQVPYASANPFLSPQAGGIRPAGQGQLEPQKDTGLVTDITRGLARGVVGLGEATAQAAKVYTGGRIGGPTAEYLGGLRDTTGFLKPDVAEVEGEGAVKRGAMGAAESLPTSLAIIPATIAGAKIGAAGGSVVAPGLGTAIGGVVGGAIGAGAAMLTLFGAGTYGKRKDEVVKELTTSRPDLPPEQVEAMAHGNAMSHAKAEVLGESIGDAAAYMIFRSVPGGSAIYRGGKAFLKELATPGVVKTIAKGIAKEMPFEVGSEVGTAYAQYKADEKIGIEKGTALENMGEAIIPAMFLSGGMGVALGGYSAYQRKQAYDNINATDVATRINAVNSVAATIEQTTQDKEVAAKWHKAAMQYVASGEKVPLDTGFSEFISEEEAHAAGVPFEELPPDMVKASAPAVATPQDVATEQLLKDTIPGAKAVSVANKVATATVETDAGVTTIKAAPADIAKQVLSGKPLADLAKPAAEKGPAYVPVVSRDTDIADGLSFTFRRIKDGVQDKVGEQYIYRPAEGMTKQDLEAGIQGKSPAVATAWLNKNAVVEKVGKPAEVVDGVVQPDRGQVAGPAEAVAAPGYAEVAQAPAIEGAPVEQVGEQRPEDIAQEPVAVPVQEVAPEQIATQPGAELESQAPTETQAGKEEATYTIEQLAGVTVRVPVQVAGYADLVYQEEPAADAIAELDDRMARYTKLLNCLAS